MSVSLKNAFTDYILNELDFILENLETFYFFQGHMPTVQLLKKYDLMQFAEVTKAVRYAIILLHCVVVQKALTIKNFIWND